MGKLVAAAPAGASTPKHKINNGSDVANFTPKCPATRHSAPDSMTENVLNRVVRNPPSGWNKPKANCPIAIAMLTAARFNAVLCINGLTKSPAVPLMPEEIMSVDIAMTVGFKKLAFAEFKIFSSYKEAESRPLLVYIHYYTRAVFFVKKEGFRFSNRIFAS
jgi:hypothetical protein